MVTDEEFGVAGVGAEVDVIATVQDAVAPGRGSVFLTARKDSCCETALCIIMLLGRRKLKGKKKGPAEI